MAGNDSLADDQLSKTASCATNYDNDRASDTLALDAKLSDSNDGVNTRTPDFPSSFIHKFSLRTCIESQPSRDPGPLQFPKNSIYELGDYNRLYPIDLIECERIIRSCRQLPIDEALFYRKGLLDNIFNTTATAKSIIGSYNAFGAKSTLAEFNAPTLELSLVNTIYLRKILCISLTKHDTAQLCQLQRRQDLLIHHVRTLVLDGIELSNSTLLIDILMLVKQRTICLKLLSLRETKILQNDFIASQIQAAAERTGFDFFRHHNSQPVLGIYLFGKKDAPETAFQKRSHANTFTESRSGTKDDIVINSDNDKGIMSAIGAQLGSEERNQQQQWLNSTSVNKTFYTQSRSSLPDNEWYQSTGMIDFGNISITWPNILQKLYSSNLPTTVFDAVLCRGPRHDPAWVKTQLAKGENGCPDANDEYKRKRKRLHYIEPKLATVALGPSGCVDCGTSPEGPASFPDSPMSHLPLLSPVPRFDSSIRHAQRPPTPFSPPPQGTDAANANAIQNLNPRLILRCETCLNGRWCEKCNRWWCENCFAGNLGRIKVAGDITQAQARTRTRTQARPIKVVSRLCVERCLVPEMMSGAGSGGMWG